MIELQKNADLAHSIRDHLSILANSLEVLRLACPPSAENSIRRAERQVEALRHLADKIQDGDQDE